MDKPDQTIETRDGDSVLRLSGPLTVDQVSGLDRLRDRPPATGNLIIDLAGVTEFDTAGALYVGDIVRQARSVGRRADVEGLDDEWSRLLEMVAGLAGEPLPPEPLTPWLARLPGHIGLAAEDAWRTGVALLGFFGRVFLAFAATAFRPARWRFTSVVYHFEAVIVNALPIVGLIAFLIGVVIAYQGAVQLRQFGVEIFTVDFLAIAIFRELGILLTAIIVAGRTASAFTAQLGSMQANEEISALKTMGLDPDLMLVLPRIIALVVGLPLLAFFADILGLVGGGLICWTVLGINPQVFIERLPDTASLWSFWLGIIKAPFFGLIIGLVGCFEGLRAGPSAESVGRHTTRAVVQSIFLVIVVDAAFSVLFSMLDI